MLFQQPTSFSSIVFLPVKAPSQDWETSPYTVYINELYFSTAAAAQSYLDSLGG